MTQTTRDLVGILAGNTQGSKMKTDITLIDRKRLHELVPISERTVFDMEKKGEFPQRIAITTRRVAWVLSEVEDWINSRRGIASQRPMSIGQSCRPNLAA